jgi:hypothetical protein
MNNNSLQQTKGIGFINFIVSFVYALLRFAFGLLIHPYQTMQDLVEEKMFIWLAILPTLVLAILTIFWDLILCPLLLASLDLDIYLISKTVSFIATWFTMFCFYWQLMLFYLLIRFKLSFNHS